MKKLFVILAVICLVSASSANAQTVLKRIHTDPEKATQTDDAEADSDSDSASDPIEPVNRVVFKFNQVVDTVAFKPISKVYRGVVPEWGRNRVSNFLYNVTEPVTVVNSVFQGDPQNAFTSAWRFIINTTFGLLGTFDAANSLGLKPHKKDFGQTLGVWGVSEGPYLVLPIIGPSDIRDTAGLGIDFATNPINWGKYTSSNERLGLYVAKAIDARSSILDITDDIERTSLDPYASYRSLYLQKRRNDVNNGKMTKSPSE